MRVIRVRIIIIHVYYTREYSYVLYMMTVQFYVLHKSCLVGTYRARPEGERFISDTYRI